VRERGLPSVAARLALLPILPGNSATGSRSDTGPRHALSEIRRRRLRNVCAARADAFNRSGRRWSDCARRRVSRDIVRMSHLDPIPALKRQLG